MITRSPTIASPRSPPPQYHACALHARVLNKAAAYNYFQQLHSVRSFFIFEKRFTKFLMEDDGDLEVANWTVDKTCEWAEDNYDSEIADCFRGKV
jgi:hypothetical protein